MKPIYKGLLLAALQLALVLSLGAKLLYDRATRPRAWAKAVPYDPNLPIRGRYLSLRLEVEAPGIRPPSEAERKGWESQRQWAWALYGSPAVVALSAEDGRLIARRESGAENYEAYREDRNTVQFRIGPDGKSFPVLLNPVVYFIPEHAEDPSRRPQGEELWVEVTIPKKGPPRPIRLGVKKGDGLITPLNLN